MFGNKIQYYGGPGGIRRGLIWQSGTGAVEPPEPYEAGLLNIPYQYGGIPYGSVMSVYYNDEADPPFYNIWEHDPNAEISSLVYDRTNKCFRFDWSEWDNNEYTPTDFINASSWKIYPLVTDASSSSPAVYTKSVSWYYDDGSGVVRALPNNSPMVNIYPISLLPTANLSLKWADDNWATRGLPFSWFRTFEGRETGYMYYNFSNFVAKSGVLNGVSRETYNVRNALIASGETDYRYYDFRIVEKMTFTTEKVNPSSYRYKGAYIFIFHNLPILAENIILS